MYISQNIYIKYIFNYILHKFMKISSNYCNNFNYPTRTHTRILKKYIIFGSIKEKNSYSLSIVYFFYIKLLREK